MFSMSCLTRALSMLVVNTFKLKKLAMLLVARLPVLLFADRDAFCSDMLKN